MSSKKVKVILADTPEKRETGLMWRKKLPTNHGMLFDFKRPQKLSFWMANTYLPLDIAFIDDDGKIGQIEAMSAPLSTRPVFSNGRYRYALEMPNGWFDQNKVGVGGTVGVGQMTGQQPGAMPQQGPQGQQQVAPDVVVEQALEDILQQASDQNLSLMITYQSISGMDTPPRTIEPPFEFKDSEEGNPYMVAWDSSKGNYASFRLENITGTFDLNGQPITNVQQLLQKTVNQPPADMPKKNIVPQQGNQEQLTEQDTNERI